jgi:hypothetical protein
MTNMTAADIGMRGRPHRALRKLAALFSAGEAAWRSALAERRPLIISGGGLEAPQAGFFLGGAGVYQAVEYCRAKVHTLGLEAEWANGVTLASLLVQQAVSGHLLRGRPVTWRWDAGERQSDSLSVLLATTLNKLVVGTRPFWNQPDDPGARQGFSVSLIAKRGPAFWWKLPRLLYGRADRKLDLDGCRSGQAQVLELWMDSPFTLDGELLAADSGEALRVELGEACRFLRV